MHAPLWPARAVPAMAGPPATVVVMCLFLGLCNNRLARPESLGTLRAMTYYLKHTVPELANEDGADVAAVQPGRMRGGGAGGSHCGAGDLGPGLLFALARTGYVSR
eukprot:11210407-Lingulodinium_polyedra.AAC.1